MESWLNGAEEPMEVSGKEDAVKTYSKQYRHLATVITGVGLTFFSITAEAETIGYEQSPGHFGGFDSNGLVFTVADEFQLDQSALTIRLFTDQSGEPGVLVGEFNVGNNANRVATGDFVNPPNPDPGASFPGRAEFKYSFDVPGPFTAKANTRYWLSILNVPVTDAWVWEVSDSLINLGVQRSFMGSPVFGPWEPYLDNTAFQVGIDPVVVSDSPEPSGVILLATVVGLTMLWKGDGGGRREPHRAVSGW
jgi:hypothetical protein